MARLVDEVKLLQTRFMAWIDRHPRIGWYIAALVVVNYIIDAAQSGLL